MRFALICLALAISHYTWAQSTSTSAKPLLSEARWSPSFGVMLTRFDISQGDRNYSVQPELGFLIGASLYIPSANPYIDYTSGIYFWNSRTRVESRFEESGTNYFLTTLVELRRLSLPFVVKVFPFRKGTGLYARAGLLNHILLNVKSGGTLYSQERNSLQRDHSREVDSLLQSQRTYSYFTFDSLIGLGYEHWGRPLSFFVELNYLYGLTPTASAGDGEIRSNSFFTSFGIGF